MLPNDFDFENRSAKSRTEADATLLSPLFYTSRESLAGTDRTKRGLWILWPIYERDEETESRGAYGSLPSESLISRR